MVAGELPNTSTATRKCGEWSAKVWGEYGARFDEGWAHSRG